jgi:hypothetical protein
VQGTPGIFELRVRHDATTILRQRGLPVSKEMKEGSGEILLRVFCHAHGKKIASTHKRGASATNAKNVGVSEGPD